MRHCVHFLLKPALASALLLGGVFSLQAQMPSESSPRGQNGSREESGGREQDGAGARRSFAIQGRVINGTTGAPVRAEVSLMQPGEGGMRTLQSLGMTGPDFVFTPVEIGDLPYLIRANFNGQLYTQVVPPTPEKMQSPQIITVYETGARADAIGMSSAVQIIKKKDTLLIRKIFAINNTSAPPRTFDTAGFSIYIPEDATNLKATVTGGHAQMAVPVAMEKLTGGYQKAGRGFRPGESELTIEYEVPGDHVSDRPSRFVDHPSGHNFVILLWQPPDARPKITGARTQDLSIPDLGEAIRLTYEETPAQFDLSSGSFLVENPMESDENPIFNSSWRTLLALGAVLISLFLIAALLSSSGVRLVRRSREA